MSANIYTIHLVYRNLEETKLVWGIRRADDNGFDISYVDISACDRKCCTEESVSWSVILEEEVGAEILTEI